MYLDVVDLREFYGSELGQLARRLMVRPLRQVWPDVRGMRVAGLGYTGPLLGVFREEAERTPAFMPARMGVVAWPADGPSSAALVDETDLPLGDGTVDRLLLVHCLEMAERSAELLREAWRVLAPGGRLLVIVPNRRGLWARFEHTPFGHGRPYSRKQLVRLMREASFTPSAWKEMLWVPPFRVHLLLRSAAAWERAGTVMPGLPPGVMAVEATKQVYSALPARGEKMRRLKPVLVPSGVPAPSARSR